MKVIKYAGAALAFMAGAACQTAQTEASVENYATGGETVISVDAVLAAETAVESALVSGDTAALEKHLADDLLFHHGDAWLEGGDFIFDDTKLSMLEVAQSGNYTLRENLESDVQVHGDVAITRGLMKGQLKREGELLTFRTRYLRVYKLNDGAWQLLTHFTTKLYLDGREPLQANG